MKKIYLIITMTLMLISTQTYADLSVLLVNDNSANTDRIENIKTAISNSGFTYTLYDAVVEGTAPSQALMDGFDLVIWYAGNDYADLFFWNGNETDNETIKNYIDGGGMLWVQGLDFLHDRYPDVPTDFVAGDFVYDYMGISQYFAQSHNDDGFFSDGVIQLDVVADNGIFTINPLTWAYETMWYVDALLPTDNGSGSYTMGPDGYDFEDYFSVIYNEKGDGKFLSCAFETARFDTQETCDAFMGEGLTYFEQFASGNAVAVEEITITSEGDASTIEVDGGSLQMYAAVLPEDATNQAVFWTIELGTGYATINSAGLVSTPGTPYCNGTVWAKATAADGSGINDSFEITISNQTNSNEFEVLLVNDNANGSDRYLELDTALMNLGANYEIYNAVTANSAPHIADLSAYDFVIWYTGNDGANLHLWDVSDTNDFKFNENLIAYVNSGGNVWLQGLDFIYDIVGSANPDEDEDDTFHSGQFVYDVMGISKYVAQSYADDDNLGVPWFDVVTNDISTFTPIKWQYETLHYVDGYEITGNATAMYTMGPTGYVFDDLIPCLYTKPSAKSYLLTWSIETARLDSDENLETVFSEVLTFIEENAGTSIQEWNTEKANIAAVYPNPAQDISTLSYQLLNSAQVQFNLLDITGRVVYSQNLGQQKVGSYEIEMSQNKMNIQNGVYLYTLSIDKQQFTGKVIFK